MVESTPTWSALLHADPLRNAHRAGGRDDRPSALSRAGDRAAGGRPAGPIGRDPRRAAPVKPLYSAAGEIIRHFLTTRLHAIDPTAELVECTAEPGPPGYRIQVRAARGLTEVLHLPGRMVLHARAADPLADYALRTLLRTMIQRLDARATAERVRAARHPWQTRPGPPGRESPPPPTG